MKYPLLLFLVAFPFSSHAYTLELFGSSVPTIGWKTNSLAFDIDYTNCPSQAAVNSALDSAISLWNSVSSSNVSLSRGNSITTSTSAAISSSHAAGNPEIICDPNYSTTLGQSGIQDVSPASAVNGIADSSGKIIYYTILLNVEAGGKASIANFSSVLTAIVLAHEIGHVLGLGHSADLNALMYYDSSARTTLNLSQDDIDGFTYLYPRSEPSSGGAFGCGSISLSGKEPPDSTNGVISFGIILLFCFLPWRWSRSRTTYS